MALISSLNKEQSSEIAKIIYDKFEKDSGKVPEWVRVMAHCPEILKEFTELFKAIMGQGKIETDLKWKIALVISKTLKCKFCVDVTEKMLKKMGADEKAIKEVEELNGTEKEILEMVKDITLDGHLDQPQLFENLKTEFNETQIVEIISVIGLFNYINRFNNTLGVLPE